MKILNFGSLNVDHVYEMEHFVRPGETLSSDKLTLTCGGKGLNQSVALARAGAAVWHAGKLGAAGAMLRDRLAENGVELSCLMVGDCPTGHAIIQVDRSGQNCIILFGGANRAITEGEVDEVLARFDSGDILLLQNEISCLGYLLEKAGEKGMRIALNPSPIDDTLTALPGLRHVKWFIMNEIEGEQLTGAAQPDEIVRRMHEKYPESDVVLTLGKRGALWTDGVRTVRHGIYDVRPVDTTAAGDTFTGFFLASVARGDSPERAMELASRASSISVGRPGASDSIPTLDEVETAELTAL